MTRALPLTIGRYSIEDEIAAGGMATVHIGRILGPVGFSRAVAIKRLHPFLAKDPDFVAMLLDEARIAARIRHPNVTPILEVVQADEELFLVMEYIIGESLARLLMTVTRKSENVSVPIAVGIGVGVLRGLHAAHEATDENGEPLQIVHRDVSPQNVLVGIDGMPRLLDFGVAKAVGRVHTTRDGQLKGKLGYMSPEQIHGTVTRQTDVFAASIVVWEMLAARRLFTGDNEGELLSRVLSMPIDPPSTHRPDVPSSIEAVVMRGLERRAEQRFATAEEMAAALEHAAGPGGIASMAEIGAWVQSVAVTSLAARADLVKRVETGATAPDSVREASGPVASARPPATDTVLLQPPRPVESAVPPSNRRRVWLAAGVIVLTLAGVGGSVARRGSSRVGPSTSPSPSASASASASTSTSTSASTIESAPTMTAVEPLPRPSTVAAGTQMVHSHKKPARDAGVVPGCNPDHTYVDGVKVYKPHCFPAP